MTTPTGPWGTDRPGPVFFLSYARPQPGLSGHDSVDRRQAWVSRFFDELSGHVAELVGLRPGGDPGFLDLATEGGRDREMEVLAAARTASVFVPLISPSYVRSTWCGKEWQVFARRPLIPLTPEGSASRAAVVPVTWLPTRDVPDVVRQVQRFDLPHLDDPGILGQYRRNGVYGLLASREDDDYDKIVWHLAQQVADVYHSVRPDPDLGNAPAADIRSAFHQEER